jgi:hypothetical protein
MSLNLDGAGERRLPQNVVENSRRAWKREANHWTRVGRGWRQQRTVANLGRPYPGYGGRALSFRNSVCLGTQCALRALPACPDSRARGFRCDPAKLARGIS